MHTLMIRKMVAATKEENLQLIGISEHAPYISITVDSFYSNNLEIIPKIINGIES